VVVGLIVKRSRSGTLILPETTSSITIKTVMEALGITISSYGDHHHRRQVAAYFDNLFYLSPGFYVDEYHHFARR